MKERYDDIDEYIGDLRGEIADAPNCANHHYNLGLALLGKRDFVAAEDSFLAAVRNSPHLAEAYVQLGGICLERGDLDGCLRYNEEAASSRSKFPIPWANIGFVHLQRGEPEKAMQALKKALKWDPEFIQAQHAMTTACFMEGEYQACADLCRKILAKEESFAPAWNNLSLSLFELKDFAGAIEAADKATALGFEVHENFLNELKPHRV